MNDAYRANWGPFRFVARCHWWAAVLVACVAARGDDLEYRTWTDSTGQFKIEAALITVKDGQVYLQKKTGEVINVPVARLSAVDQRFLTADKPAPPAANASPVSVESIRAAVAVLQRTERDSGGRWYSNPAVLIAVVGDHGYVVSIASMHPGSEPAFRERKQYVFRVLLYPNTERQTTVEAEPLGIDSLRGLAVWRVPGRELPAPLRLDDPSTTAEGEQVALIGTQAERLTDGTWTHKWAVRRGIISAIFRADDGSVTEYEIRGDGVGDLRQAAVVDRRLKTVGLAKGVRPKTYRDPRGEPDMNQTRVLPAQSLADMGTPSLKKVEMEAVVWEEGGVVYELTAEVVDPFSRGDETQLLFQRLQGPVPAPQRTTGGYAPVAPDMKQVVLEKAKTLDMVRGKFTSKRQIPPTARWRDEEPLPDGSLPVYVVQLRTVDAVGQTSVSVPLEVTPQMLGKQLRAYLGFFAKLKHPALPHSHGGLRITSEATRAAGEAANRLVKVANTGPQPTASSERPISKNPQHGIVGKRTVRCLRNGAWSGNGRAFFLAEYHTPWIRRFAVPELKQTTVINLGGLVRTIAISKEGLLALTAHADGGDKLWVLDTNTLEVKRCLAIDGIEVVSSPNSSIAVVAAGKQALGDRTHPGRLAVVDVAEGRIVHLIENATDPTFPLMEMAITLDGEYLFGVCDGSLLRFRLDQGDLLFEQRSLPIEARNPVLSTDGEYVVVTANPDEHRVNIPNHPVGRGGYVYEGMDLSQPKVMWRSTGSWVLGADRPAGYVVSGGVKSYGYDGKSLGGFDVPVHWLFVHRQTDRLLVLYEGGLSWLDPAGEDLADADPEQATETLMKLLDWTIESFDEPQAELKWVQLSPEARGTVYLRDTLDKLREVKGHAWSPDGKKFYVSSQREVLRYSLEDDRLTHRLQFPGSSFDHGRKVVATCTEGLLVFSAGRLTLTDWDTLRPKRVVARDFKTGIFFAAAPGGSHVVVMETDPPKRIVVVDVRTGKEVSQWTPDDDTSPANFYFTEKAVLSYEGRDFFMGGKPASHFTIDKAGQIELRGPLAIKGTEGATLPQSMNAPQTVAFRTSEEGWRTWLCDVDNPTTPIVGSDPFDGFWLYDSQNETYLSVSVMGEIVGYDRNAKQKFRIPPEAMRQLDHWGPCRMGAMPAQGGRLILVSTGGMFLLEFTKQGE